ncbi:hypothetical protein P7K49_016949 [Saguinus oedipus]|uniref:Uncharacterized protein n=1 Tax=Saguinus oedipus TaxID=9490 RepID=A0ABQ9V167_SAGOE|nr:hypothetical protein P7K49_016949 [Saguinus oedipus]
MFPQDTSDLLNIHRDKGCDRGFVLLALLVTYAERNSGKVCHLISKEAVKTELQFSVYIRNKTQTLTQNASASLSSADSPTLRELIVQISGPRIALDASFSFHLSTWIVENRTAVHDVVKAKRVQD